MDSELLSSTSKEQCSIKKIYYFRKKQRYKGSAQVKQLLDWKGGVFSHLTIQSAHWLKSQAGLRVPAPVWGRRRWVLQCRQLTWQPGVASHSQGTAAVPERLAHVAELDALQLEPSPLSLERLHNQDGSQLPRAQLPLTPLVQTPRAT